MAFSLFPMKEYEDEFIGYNEWAQTYLGVEICTDFVYDECEQELFIENDEEKEEIVLYERTIKPKTIIMKERGVYISEDILPQTKVFSIPFGSLMTFYSIQNSILSGLDFFQTYHQDKEDDQLAIYLLYEYYCVASHSKWFKHFQLLPKKYHNLLYFDQVNEIEQLFKRSHLYHIAKELQAKTQNDYLQLKSSVLPQVFELILLAHQDYPLTYEQLEIYFSLEKYMWALSTIWSRFVSLSFDQQVAKEVQDSSSSSSSRSNNNRLVALKAMVPVFDMLNHSFEAEMTHEFDMETQSFHLISHQHWHAGSQLYIHYGGIPNHKLVTLYGFAIAQNPFDCIDFWLPLDAHNKMTTSWYDLKIKLLVENGIDHRTTCFQLTAHSIDVLLLMLARIQAIEASKEEEVRHFVAQVLNDPYQIVSIENEQKALTRLILILQEMLEQYPKKDQKVVFDEKIDPWHFEMAAIVCKSDQNILEKSIELLEEKLLEILPSPLPL
jgi:histone-lysine N-methyltransferase SETD3